MNIYDNEQNTSFISMYIKTKGNLFMSLRNQCM